MSNAADAPTDDALVFTEYVKVIEQSPEIPAPVLIKLRRLVRYHMQRRNLWISPYNRPPELDNLVLDCFDAAFFGEKGKQLTYLKKRVNAGQSIDALVNQKVSNFIHDLHIDLYPEDAAVYKNLRLALKNALQAGALKELEKNTLYGLGTEDRLPVSVDALESHVSNCPLWAEAISRIRRISEGAAKLAFEAIVEMLPQGIEPFLFNDLQNVLISVSKRMLSGDQTSNRRSSSLHAGISQVMRHNTSAQQLEDVVARIMDTINNGPSLTQTGDVLRATLLAIAGCVARGEEINIPKLAESLGISRNSFRYYLTRLREMLR